MNIKKVRDFVIFATFAAGLGYIINNQLNRAIEVGNRRILPCHSISDIFVERVADDFDGDKIPDVVRVTSGPELRDFRRVEYRAPTKQEIKDYREIMSK